MNLAASPSPRGSGMRISNGVTTGKIERGMDLHSSYLGQCEVEAGLDSSGGRRHRRGSTASKIGREGWEGDPSLCMNANVAWPINQRVYRLEAYLLTVYL
jgi:hypothetical protein